MFGDVDMSHIWVCIPSLPVLPCEFLEPPDTSQQKAFKRSKYFQTQGMTGGSWKTRTR